jgi:hypothetical protein
MHLAMLNMTAKWNWVLLISGPLVALPAAQARLQAAAHDDLRDYLKKEMRELRIPGMQVAVIRHQKIVFLAALGIAEVGNAVPVSNKTVFAKVSGVQRGAALVGALHLTPSRAQGHLYILGIPWNCASYAAVDV